VNHVPSLSAAETRLVRRAAAAVFRRLLALRGSGRRPSGAPPAANLPSNPKPPYPADAYAAGQQGRVVLEVHVNAEGTVDSLRVKTTSGFAAFDQSALDTVAT
jgi:outer membrane biosynthesis protein TonB